MKYIEHHIKEAENILDFYKGGEPLHLYLKKYFGKNKKFGSKDRKAIATYVYGVFRLGRENRHLTIRQRIYLYLFLKDELPNVLIEANFPELLPFKDLQFNERWDKCQELFDLRDTYKFQNEVSNRLNSLDYRRSFYFEPAVFIRLRNNTANRYRDVIAKHGGKMISEDVVVFSSRARLDDIFEAADYVVQDRNSQLTMRFLPTLKKDAWVWDCCAGSGGKSILLLDLFQEIHLVATDIRQAILRNLINRFELYGHEAEVIAELNVNKGKELEILEDLKFDAIVCDVPCSGSGTWARTPEQMFFFDKKEISKYQRRQLDILQNIHSRLNSVGYLLYITCSVFRKENEDVVQQFIQQNKEVQLIKDAYLDGTTMLADTMYVALLQKT